MGIEAIVLLFFVFIFAMQDVKEQSIDMRLILIVTALVFVHQVALLYMGQRSLADIGLGVLPGICMVALSRITGGKIGIGDGIIFVLLGAVQGMGRVCAVIIVSFALVAILTLCYIPFAMAKGMRIQKKQIPFLPFIFVSMICTMM